MGWDCMQLVGGFLKIFLQFAYFLQRVFKFRDMVMDIMQEKLQAQFAGMKAPNKS